MPTVPLTLLRPHHCVEPSAARRDPRLAAYASGPHFGAATQDGAVLRTAWRRKHATYLELADGGAQALCVLGCEVGGRWSTDAVMLVKRLDTLPRAQGHPRLGAPSQKPRGRAAGGACSPSRSNTPLVTLRSGAPGPCRARHTLMRRT